MAEKRSPVRPGKDPSFRKTGVDSPDSFHRAMSLLADDFFTSFDLLPLSVFEDTERFISRVYITRSRDAITVTAELPGMDPDDIEITLGSDTLIIAGEKKIQKQRRQSGMIRDDPSAGSFRKMITIPYSIDAVNAKASFSDGVLLITLPRRIEKSRARLRIPIKKTR